MPTKPSPDTEALRAALKEAFPDAHVGDDLTRALQQAVREGDMISSSEAASLPGAPLSFDQADAAIRYYSARATHTRAIGTTSIFEAIVPMARVALPQKGGTEPIETGLGVMTANDRKILSVSQVKSLVGRTPARVEHIASVRAPDASGARFGGVGLYLCYEHEGDRAPSYYIIEAGTATGQPKVLFYAEEFGTWIKGHVAYEPTPFSSPNNYYYGIVRMSEDDPNEPLKLTIEGRTSRDAEWYIQVCATYHIMEQPPVYKPLCLILEAAARVGIIGKALGFDTDASIDVACCFLGDSLEWIVKPGE